MITTQHREEQLSRAYVNAVAAKAGHIFDPPGLDYGVDGSLKHVKERNGRRVQSGYSLDLQLKATTNWSVRDDNVIYDLEAKTYNDLVDRFATDRATPMILAVLCLPPAEDDWLTVGHDELTLRHSCYWCQLSGPPTQNKQQQRIVIPRGNLLTPEAVAHLLQKVVEGEAL